MEEKNSMISLTPIAITKVQSILAELKEKANLRIAVVGGGCSGFQYQMSLDKEIREDDKVLEMGGLKVLVDTKSLLYLDGTKIDYVEGESGSGFKFDNPNLYDTYGAGERFEA